MSIVQSAKETIAAGLQRLFPESPRVQAMADALLDEQEAARLQKRQEWRAELGRIDAANSAEHTAFQPLREADLKAHAAKVSELRAFEQEIGRRHGDHRGRVMTFELQISHLKGQLRSTASPLIEQFVSEMRTLLKETYESQDSIAVRMISGYDRTTWSNSGSITTRAAAIRDVIARASELTEAALTDAELLAEFDELRASLPALAPRPAHDSALALGLAS